MIIYFFLKGHGRKRILKELVNTLQDNAISLSTIKNWLRRFKSGDLSGATKKNIEDV
jgi:transposase